MDREDNSAAPDGQNPEAEPGGGRLRIVVPIDDDCSEELGGDPVCWAHLVCEECGAITTEGHRAWCAHAARS